MAKFWAFLLAGATLVAASSLAGAADLLPPAPAELPPAPAVGAAEFGGWYLRGDIGVGINAGAINPSISPDPIATGRASGFLSANATNTFNNTTLSSSAMFDVGVGYAVNNWFRMDVTGEYRGGGHLQTLETLNDPTFPTGTGSAQFADFYRGDVSSYIGLLNGYADLGSWSGISPFVGAGIGFAYNRLAGLTDIGQANPGTGATSPAGGYFANGSKTSFAWALMAGLDFDVTQNLKMELGYRYLDYGSVRSGGSNCLNGTGLNGGFSPANCGGSANVLSTGRLASNDFRLGLIYMIPETPSYAPPPVVRRY